MELIKFGQEDIANVLSTMSGKDIDNLAFGAVKVDYNGVILTYNSAEGEITGRKSQDVLGKNFFTEVAPCTNSPEFYGKFENGKHDAGFSTMFEYVFDYQMVPTKVRVHMKQGYEEKTIWIFIKRL